MTYTLIPKREGPNYFLPSFQPSSTSVLVVVRARQSCHETLSRRAGPQRRPRQDDGHVLLVLSIRPPLYLSLHARVMDGNNSR